MLKNKLSHYHIILASASPRRQNFLKELGWPFEVHLKPIKEIFPESLRSYEISDYLSKLKAEPFLKDLQPNDLLITSDTIVWYKNEALGKPLDANDAFNMISKLNNDTHQVITSICITSTARQVVVNDTTEVTFNKLSEDAIWYYIDQYKPYDKAGAYGIQEWIGTIGVSKIKGSYNNVMGMPTHLLYETLNTFF